MWCIHWSEKKHWRHTRQVIRFGMAASLSILVTFLFFPAWHTHTRAYTHTLYMYNACCAGLWGKMPLSISEMPNWHFLSEVAGELAGQQSSFVLSLSQDPQVTLNKNQQQQYLTICSTRIQRYRIHGYWDMLTSFTDEILEANFPQRKEAQFHILDLEPRRTYLIHLCVL